MAAPSPARAIDHACYVHYVYPDVPDKLTGLIGRSPDDLDDDKTSGLRTFIVALGFKRVGTKTEISSEIVEV